jgi:hypothetical protein
MHPAAGSCWALIDTAANRQIGRRYPVILRSRFPESSAAWVRSLTADGPTPRRPGLLWIDPRSGVLRPVRTRRPGERGGARVESDGARAENGRYPS